MNKPLQKLQPTKQYFEVKSKLGIRVSTTLGYWNLITTIKHPTVKGRELEVKQALYEPDEIRVSRKDKMVLLFYKMFDKRYLCVVVRFFKKKGFIITAYWTKKIKEGELRWKR